MGKGMECFVPPEHDHLFCGCMQVSAALPGEGRVPALREKGVSRPGATSFCRQAKGGKSWLRGFTPKDPVFLEQGRGGVYIRNGIGSGITYEPQRFRNYACRPVKR